ncbi:kinase-like domain-containing protein [Phascolomyces articulosus]|uniref:Kinase-like domain-containing protein n=1 Tax=Phascolomyces articulosus TaxID=60185 RepID=A0AAD5K432_9FUNG|nr:kinase-like domain-containing protein [Phascolomyces articulosus]
MVFVPPDSSKPTAPTLAPPPGPGLGGRFGNKRRGGPGLKLSFEHLQTPPASSIPSSTDAPANNNQNTFREQVGNIVAGGNTSSSRSALHQAISDPTSITTNIPNKPITTRYPGCGEDDEDEDDGDESLAAVYLAAAKEQQNQQQQSQSRRNQHIPVLREAPRPPLGPPAVGSVASRYYPGDNVKNNTTPASSSASSSSSSSATTTSTENTDSNDNSQFMEMKPEDLDIIKLLGEGAAGTVRKVLHKPTGLIMAKKTIGTDPNPKVQRQILRELSFQKTCNSSYIVSFYGAFLEDGDTTLSLCMEYCEAGSLEDIYKRARDLGGVIGEPVLGRIAESVCKGLVYLHSQRVIHRDIKPSNILVTRKGEIKLCDFGVSGELINSIAKTFTGTKYYMAPERIQGAPYAVQSDIWSLGLTLIEVSQNRPALPPPGQPQLSIIELLDLIVRQPVPVIQGSHISKECRNFVAVCLIKNPRDRPGPGRMLDHPFIRKWEDVPMDLAGWIKEVWNWK